MSRFHKLSHTIWHCQYHIVWVPKYRFRILSSKVGEEVDKCVRAFCEQQGAEVVELNIQIDHVHLLVLVLLGYGIQHGVGWIEGRGMDGVRDKIVFISPFHYFR